MSDIDDNAIEQITADRGPHYEPFGWHHWPEHPWLAYQFRRGLGETQEGGGSVSEVFQAASRMIPGDLESWHAEWHADRGSQLAARSRRRAGRSRPHRDELLPPRGRLLPSGRVSSGRRRSASACRPSRRWKHAARNSSRTSIRPVKPSTFLTSRASQFAPISCARRFPAKQLPVLICMGGLDSIKDEMWFMQAHGCLQRGISVLMIDGPGQGGTLRRHKLRQSARYRSADWQMHRLAAATPRCRSKAHRRVRLEHGRLLRRASRLLRASPRSRDLAWRDLVIDGYVGE